MSVFQMGLATHECSKLESTLDQ